MINVADDRKNRKQLRKMQRYLKQELGRFVQRPFGEFIPGGNAVPGDAQTDLRPLLKRIAAEMK